MWTWDYGLETVPHIMEYFELAEVFLFLFPWLFIIYFFFLEKKMLFDVVVLGGPKRLFFVDFSAV